jgi:hypothetical protein
VHLHEVYLPLLVGEELLVVVDAHAHQALPQLVDERAGSVRRVLTGCGGEKRGEGRGGGTCGAYSQPGETEGLIAISTHLHDLLLVVRGGLVRLHNTQWATKVEE